jgi:S-DNA-T family DNA segregation ATPase FtsK/SpoIIIE
LQKKSESAERLEMAVKRALFLLEPVKELYHGVRSNTLPWPQCAGWLLASGFILFFKIDYFLISHTKLSLLYPYFPPLYKVYAFSFSTAGFWGWALWEVKRKRDKLAILTAAFKNSGLESKIGRLPNLVFDHSIDQMTRKMRLTNAGFPVSSFQAQSRYIESALGIFIDHIKENRQNRSIDILYSHFPMTTEVMYEPNHSEHETEFFVGQTRSRMLRSNLKESPHLLVAGLTSSGKSTFLRQFIVHLALKNKSTRFLLIDLKGGLEFSLFEERKQFSVVPSVLHATEELKKMDSVLTTRMEFLKSINCKDIDAFLRKGPKTDNAPHMGRHIVVVDEAAEMFLAGHHAKAAEIQAARAILSRIARQGRAVGVHLVVATQRPDTRSLDPQVKANLAGVVCFQMMNDSSSIAVLGNGRATDLPKVPGRAIWKNGIEMIEVQTPLLLVEDAEKLLGEPDAKSKPGATLEKKNFDSTEETTLSKEVALASSTD